MTDLVPIDTTPGRSPADERWERELRLVGEWLKDQGTNTRASYADALGWPYSLLTGEPRDVTRLRNGVSWLTWCRRRGVHVLDADRQLVLDWVEALEKTPHPTTGKHLAKRSRAQTVSAAFSFYAWCVEEGHLEANPVQFNRTKKGLNTSKDKSPTRSLSDDEVRAMIRTADEDPVQDVRLRTSAIIALLYMVGLRVGELVGADLADLQIQDGIRAVRVELKGKREHWFPIPDAAGRRLDAYLASRADLDRLPARVGDANASSPPLIATSTGGRMQRSEVFRLSKRVAVLAGLRAPETVPPHAARHSYVTGSRRGGFNSEEIRAALGHAYTSTTDRYGLHVMNLASSPAHAMAERFDVDTPPATEA